MHSTASVNETTPNDNGDCAGRGSGARGEGCSMGNGGARRKGRPETVPQNWERHSSPREHALWYARTLGWKVVPGHWTTEGGCTCGHAACEEPGAHPLEDDWPAVATSDPARIEELWRAHPEASVLVITGGGVTAIELPASKGWGVLEVLERHATDVGPVVDGRQPSGVRFWFFVDGLETEDETVDTDGSRRPAAGDGTVRVPADIRAVPNLDLVVHADRSWVQLPTADAVTGPVWSVPPVRYDSAAGGFVRRTPADLTQLWEAIREQFC